MKNNTKEKGLFATLLQREKILCHEDFKQIVKIQDLQAFAKSIIEIMVGKCEQTDFKVKH